MNSDATTLTARRARGIARTAAAALMAVLLTASCSDLTKVDAPDLVERPDLENMSGAVTLFNGAVGSFYNVFGSTLSNSGPFITATGLLSDELTGAGAQSGVTELDKLTLQANFSFGVYTNLQTARRNQLQTLAVLKQVLPSQRWRIGQIYGLLGYTEVLLAESMCSGVPLGELASDFAPLYGPPLTTTQLLERALVDFDSAVSYATDSARIANMARIGRGRVLIDLGRGADAAAAVASVPTNALVVTEHSAAVNPNQVANHIMTIRFASIADREGGNGLDFISATDPRIGAVQVGTGADGATPLYRPARISSTASPNVFATGVEARLIEAEATLSAGDANAWLAKLNALRATAITPPMASLADPGTAAARVTMLFRERAFWLFLTGHRLGDMRRLVRQYGRSTASVFPTGAYKYGGTFGTDYTLPLDQAEISANPMLGGNGCIDRNP